jgi:tetratricopeptide (TPR) repeat protein
MPSRVNSSNRKSSENTDRGVAYRRIGDFERATADYDQAVALKPNAAQAYNNRGYVYQLRGDLDHALADYNQAIMLDPKFALAYENRAELYDDMGNRLGALADYTQAIALDPNNSYAYNGRCWVRAVLSRQLQEALADCNNSLRLRSSSAATLDSRGFVYLRLARYDESIADFDAAVTIDPKLASSFYGRGLAKRAKGDAVGATTDIAAAKALQADIADVMARDGFQ